MLADPCDGQHVTNAVHIPDRGFEGKDSVFEEEVVVVDSNVNASGCTFKDLICKNGNVLFDEKSRALSIQCPGGHCHVDGESAVESIFARDVIFIRKSWCGGNVESLKGGVSCEDAKIDGNICAHQFVRLLRSSARNIDSRTSSICIDNTGKDHEFGRIVARVNVRTTGVSCYTIAALEGDVECKHTTVKTIKGKQKIDLSDTTLEHAITDGVANLCRVTGDSVNAVRAICATDCCLKLFSVPLGTLYVKGNRCNAFMECQGVAIITDSKVDELVMYAPFGVLSLDLSNTQIQKLVVKLCCPDDTSHSVASFAQNSLVAPKGRALGLDASRYSNHGETATVREKGCVMDIAGQTFCITTESIGSFSSYFMDDLWNKFGHRLRFGMYGTINGRQYVISRHRDRFFPVREKDGLVPRVKLVITSSTSSSSFIGSIEFEDCVGDLEAAATVFIESVLTTGENNREKLQQKEKGSVDGTCVVCMDAKSNHVLLPCGHLCLCETCATKVKTCPACRAKIVSRTRVFAL